MEKERKTQLVDNAHTHTHVKAVLDSNQVVLIRYCTHVGVFTF